MMPEAGECTANKWPKDINPHCVSAVNECLTVFEVEIGWSCIVSSSDHGLEEWLNKANGGVQASSRNFTCTKNHTEEGHSDGNAIDKKLLGAEVVLDGEDDADEDEGTEELRKENLSVIHITFTLHSIGLAGVCNSRAQKSDTWINSLDGVGVDSLVCHEDAEYTKDGAENFCNPDHASKHKILHQVLSALLDEDGHCHCRIKVTTTDASEKDNVAHQHKTY